MYDHRPRSVRNGRKRSALPSTPPGAPGRNVDGGMPTGDARNAALEILHYDAVAQRAEMERLQQNAGSQQARIDYLEGANAELCIELQATNDHHQRRIADLQQVRPSLSWSLLLATRQRFPQRRSGARSRPRGERLCVQGWGRMREGCDFARSLPACGELRGRPRGMQALTREDAPAPRPQREGAGGGERKGPGI